MPTSRTPKPGELDPRSVTVSFGPELRRSFGDLAAAVRFDESFDSDMRDIVEGWATKGRASVQDLLAALPLIAAKTFQHVHTTGDKQAKEAWLDIGIQLAEPNFTLQQSRLRNR
jgi:hypothetical protein